MPSLHDHSPKPALTLEESEPFHDAKKTVEHIYLLQALSIVIPFFIFVALIILYIRKNITEKTWLLTHIKWQETTLWYTFIWYLMSILLSLFYLGLPSVLLLTVWHGYRVGKGWLNLKENRLMY